MGCVSRFSAGRHCLQRPGAGLYPAGRGRHAEGPGHPQQPGGLEEGEPAGEVGLEPTCLTVLLPASQFPPQAASGFDLNTLLSQEYILRCPLPPSKTSWKRVFEKHCSCILGYSPNTLFTQSSRDHAIGFCVHQRPHHSGSEVRVPRRSALQPFLWLSLQG